MSASRTPAAAIICGICGICGMCVVFVVCAVRAPVLCMTRIQAPRVAAVDASVTFGSVVTHPEVHERMRTLPASTIVSASTDACTLPMDVKRAYRAGPSLERGQIPARPAATALVCSGCELRDQVLEDRPARRRTTLVLRETKRALQSGVKLRPRMFVYMGTAM